MYNHQPPEYTCPFCELVAGRESKLNHVADIVAQNDLAYATISPRWLVNNEGHVLVIPKQHCENIYDIPEDVFAEIYKLVKKVSLAIRETYGCEGVSTRQHNEPAGSQDVWHLHVHVFPRYIDDNLYKSDEKPDYETAESMQVFAKKLQAYFASRA